MREGDDCPVCAPGKIRRTGNAMHRETKFGYVELMFRQTELGVADVLNVRAEGFSVDDFTHTCSNCRRAWNVDKHGNIITPSPPSFD